MLVCGFTKHFLGYYLNIWTWYCNNGNACSEVLNNSFKYVSMSDNLLVESIIEGMLFFIIGGPFIKYTNKYIIYFLIGFILHLMFEIIKIHHTFCKNKCKKRNN